MLQAGVVLYLAVVRPYKELKDNAFEITYASALLLFSFFLLPYHDKDGTKGSWDVVNLTVLSAPLVALSIYESVFTVIRCIRCVRRNKYKVDGEESKTQDAVENFS